jgi:hypothetical protein
MTDARDPFPSREPASAFAEMKHLREMDPNFTQPDPDVVVTVLRSGRRLRWCRVFRSTIWRLVSAEEPNHTGEAA